MKDRIDIELDMLKREMNVTRANIKLCDEALFWLSIAQIYLDTRTMYGILECDSIIKCTKKMHLE